MSQVITEDGEIVTGTDIAEVDTGMVSKLARVELDSLIATARQWPRSIGKAQQRMMDMAILDEETAAECTYALPRGGKTIEGPSIRFAELVFQCWGNARIAAFTTEVDRTEKFVEAQGMFLDCETNAATLLRTRRRISGQNGKVYNDDMILTTSNAAQSIARRNVILAGVPKNIWAKAHAAARRVVMGDIKTLGTRRADAVAAFTRFGLTAEQVFLIMGVENIMDITQEHLVPLKGMWSQLKNEEITVEQLIGCAGATKPAAGGAQRIASNPLNDPGQEREQPKPAEKTTAEAIAERNASLKTIPTVDEKKPESRLSSDGSPEEPEEEEVEETAAAANDISEQEAADAERVAAAVAAEEKAAEAKRIAAEAKKERAAKKAAEKPAEEAKAPEATKPEKAEVLSTETEANPEDVTVAYERGAKAFRRGQNRKLDPVEWRTPAYKPLTEAWLKGWQDACTEAENS